MVSKRATTRVLRIPAELQNGERQVFTAKPYFLIYKVNTLRESKITCCKYTVGSGCGIVHQLHEFDSHLRLLSLSHSEGSHREQYYCCIVKHPFLPVRNRCQTVRYVRLWENLRSNTVYVRMQGGHLRSALISYMKTKLYNDNKLCNNNLCTYVVCKQILQQITVNLKGSEEEGCKNIQFFYYS